VDEGLAFKMNFRHTSDIKSDSGASVHTAVCISQVMTEFAARLTALHINVFVFLSIPSPTKVMFNKLRTSVDTNT
jgi:hypothetical protein